MKFFRSQMFFTTLLFSLLMLAGPALAADPFDNIRRQCGAVVGIRHVLTRRTHPGWHGVDQMLAQGRYLIDGTRGTADPLFFETRRMCEQVPNADGIRIGGWNREVEILIDVVEED